MLQEKANEIIKNYFGTNTIVLGSSRNTIFWTYDDEPEELYRIFEIEETFSKE